MDEKLKKKRSPNFSSEEINLLVNLIIKYSHIIESKKTDAVTWQQKGEEWIKLTSEFNGKNRGVPRTVNCLKTKYETLKKEIRKKAARHKQELFKTGGGVCEAPQLSPNEEAIYNIIQLSVEGLPGRYDDDNISVINEEQREEKEENTMHQEQNDEELILIEVEDSTNQTPEGTQEMQKSKSKQKQWNHSRISKSYETNRRQNLLSKLQAAQKINVLAEHKKALLELQVTYLKEEIDFSRKEREIKLKKIEADLKSAQLDIEIKMIKKDIEQDTLRSIVKQNFRNESDS